MASSRAVDLFLPAAGGTEALLATEVQGLLGRTAQAGRGGVWVTGDMTDAMRLNLESRLAQRVLWPLVDGPYRDEHDLYDLARRVDWPAWITPGHTLRVDVHAHHLRPHPHHGLELGMLLHRPLIHPLHDR